MDGSRRSVFNARRYLLAVALALLLASVAAVACLALTPSALAAPVPSFVGPLQDYHAARAVMRGNPAPLAFRQVCAVSAAPVTDLAFDPTDEQALAWTFYANGDYDQNGEVNQADMVPIAQYYNMTSSHLDWASARVADGDGNGEINQADIVPIAQSYGAATTHFVLYSSDSESGPFEPSEPFNPIKYATTQFDSAPLPAGGGPRQYSHRIAYPIVGKYYTIVAYNGAEPSAVHSNVVQFNPTANIPPLAGFAFDTSGERMTGVLAVIHSNASDSDGMIVEYAWDMLGDGNWISSSNAPDFEFQYTQPGAYAPALRVTDNAGGTSISSYPAPEITVSDGAVHTQVVDSGNDAGYQLSCDIIDGQPAIAYLKFDAGAELYYTRATGSGTPVWNTPVLVQTGGGAPALTELGGAPAIAYSKDGLSFILANDANGASWNTPVVIAPNVNQFALRGGLPELDTLGSRPIAADYLFQAASPGNVYVSQSTDVLGGVWGAESQIGGAASNGIQPTLAVFDGSFTSVVYQHYIDSATYDIYYISSLGSNIQLGWYPLTVVDTDNARLSHDCSMVAAKPVYPSLDKPVIAYWNADTGMLRSISCAERATIGQSTLSDIDATGGTNSHFSLALIDNQPAVAYVDATTQELRFAWADSRLATGWSTPVVLDSGAEFRNPVLLDYNWWPAVAYQDADTGELMFAYVAAE